MAAIVSSAPHLHGAQSRHFLAHPSAFAHGSFGSPHHVPSNAHTHPRHVQHGFESFAPHHGSTPASTTSSWRTHAPASPAPVKDQSAPIPIKQRSAGQSPARYTHSRSPSSSSSSSEASSSWRARSTPASSIPASPEKQTAQLVSVEAQTPADVPKTARAGPLVYPITDLLRLSASPLVGVSSAAQALLEEHVAHHVWRRGPNGSIIRPNNGGRPRRRAPEATSTDSESN